MKLVGQPAALLFLGQCHSAQVVTHPRLIGANPLGQLGERAAQVVDLLHPAHRTLQPFEVTPGNPGCPAVQFLERADDIGDSERNSQ